MSLGDQASQTPVSVPPQETVLLLAWLAGMPASFWGIDAAQKGQPPLQAVLLVAGALFLAVEWLERSMEPFLSG